MPRKDLSNLKRTLEKATRKFESLGGQTEYPDPVVFCTEKLSLRPTEYQSKVLLDESKFLALRWSRQSGKTAVVSARLLWDAVRQPGTSIAIVSPSLRQSKQDLGRIASDARVLPTKLVVAVQEARMDFNNGSIN